MEYRSKYFRSPTAVCSLLLAVAIQGASLGDVRAGEHTVYATDSGILSILEPGDNTYLLKRVSFAPEGGELEEWSQLQNHAHLAKAAPWAPRLIGDRERILLEAPQLSYLIRVFAARDSFYVELGCRFVDQKVDFIPVGFEWDKKLGSREAYETQENYRKSKPPYYVSEVHLGGIKTQGLSFVPAKGSPPFPKNEEYRFDGTPDGEELFKEAARDLLRKYSEQFLLDADSFQRFESPQSGLVVNGSYRAPQLQKPRFSLARLLGFGGLEPNSQSTPGTPNLEDLRNQVALQKTIEGYVTAFKSYVEGLVQSGVRTPLVLLAEPHPLERGLAYSAVDRDVYSRAVPKLLKLAEKYTLQVYEARDPEDDQIVARIQLFPSERGTFAQVRAPQLTWLHAQGKGALVEVAIMHAFSDLRKAAPHLFVGPRE